MGVSTIIPAEKQQAVLPASVFAVALDPIDVFGTIATPEQLLLLMNLLSLNPDRFSGVGVTPHAFQNEEDEREKKKKEALEAGIILGGVRDQVEEIARINARLDEIAKELEDVRKQKGLAYIFKYSPEQVAINRQKALIQNSLQKLMQDQKTALDEVIKACQQISPEAARKFAQVLKDSELVITGRYCFKNEPESLGKFQHVIYKENDAKGEARYYSFNAVTAEKTYLKEALGAEEYRKVVREIGRQLYHGEKFGNENPQAAAQYNKDYWDWISQTDKEDKDFNHAKNFIRDSIKLTPLYELESDLLELREQSKALEKSKRILDEKRNELGSDDPDVKKLLDERQKLLLDRDERLRNLPRNLQVSENIIIDIRSKGQVWMANRNDITAVPAAIVALKSAEPAAPKEEPQHSTVTPTAAQKYDTGKKDSNLSENFLKSAQKPVQPAGGAAGGDSVKPGVEKSVALAVKPPEFTKPG